MCARWKYVRVLPSTVVCARARACVRVWVRVCVDERGWVVWKHYLPADRREHIVAPGFATTGVAPHSVSTPMLVSRAVHSRLVGPQRQHTKYTHSEHTKYTYCAPHAYLLSTAIACLRACVRACGW